MTKDAEPDVYEAAGRNLRARRLAAGLTLEDLGELAGLGPGYIGQIERNRKKASLKTYALLAAALGLSVTALLASKGGRAPQNRFAGRLERVLRRATKRERELLIAAVRHLARGLEALR